MKSILIALCLCVTVFAELQSAPMPEEFFSAYSPKGKLAAKAWERIQKGEPSKEEAARDAKNYGFLLKGIQESHASAPEASQAYLKELAPLIVEMIIVEAEEGRAKLDTKTMRSLELLFSKLKKNEHSDSILTLLHAGLMEIRMRSFFPAPLETVRIKIEQLIDITLSERAALAEQGEAERDIKQLKTRLAELKKKDPEAAQEVQDELTIKVPMLDKLKNPIMASDAVAKSFQKARTKFNEIYDLLGEGEELSVKALLDNLDQLDLATSELDREFQNRLAQLKDSDSRKKDLKPIITNSFITPLAALKKDLQQDESEFQKGYTASGLAPQLEFRLKHLKQFRAIRQTGTKEDIKVAEPILRLLFPPKKLEKPKRG